MQQVKNGVASFFPCYVNMLRWEQHGNVITATPKKPLGDQAHQLISKAFHSCGGRYVRRGGVSYFELFLKGAEQSGFRRISPFSSSNSPVGGAEGGRFSPHAPEPVFTRLQNQLSSLTDADKQLTE